MLRFGVGHRAAAVVPKGTVAVLAENTITGGISEFLEICYELIAVSCALCYVFSIYVVHGKKLEWMWTAWFAMMIARTYKSTIGHKSFYAHIFIIISFILPLLFHPFRVNHVFFSIFSLSIIVIIFSFLPIYFAQQAGFFRGPRLMRGGISVDKCARSRAILGSFFFCLKRFSTSWTNVREYFGNFCSYSRHWSMIWYNMKNVNTIGFMP